jgi:hypothetical protein
MRAVQGKGRDLDVETLAGFAFHLIGADHDARRRAERGAAGVLEALPRIEHRLLADHAGAADLLDLAVGVGDPPVAVDQLDRRLADVLDLDVVGPDVMVVGRRGLIVQIVGLHGDADVLRGVAVHRIHRAYRWSGARSAGRPERTS